MKLSSIPSLVKADQTLSEKEKKYFAIEFNNDQEKLRLRREKEDRDWGAKVPDFHPLFL